MQHCRLVRNNGAGDIPSSSKGIIQDCQVRLLCFSECFIVWIIRSCPLFGEIGVRCQMAKFSTSKLRSLHLDYRIVRTRCWITLLELGCSSIAMFGHFKKKSTEKRYCRPFNSNKSMAFLDQGQSDILWEIRLFLVLSLMSSTNAAFGYDVLNVTSHTWPKHNFTCQCFCILLCLYEIRILPPTFLHDMFVVSPV